MFQGKSHSAKEWGDLVRRATTHRGPWPRVSVWHGDLDATVKLANAESLVQQWTDMHGIDEAPVEDKVDGYPRKIWRRDGVDLIEAYTITGMAHGTPLATQAHGGAAGPFLLEVGISSSYHIAKFFGLTGEARVRADLNASTAARTETDRSPLVPADVEIIPDHRVEILNGKADEPKFDHAARGPIDVMSIITKALTSAGLMKPPT
jgi:feruloyl esterase